jgi:hypothetical protein
MTMLKMLANALYHRIAIPTALARRPDQVIGTAADPYLHRWYLTPWRTAYEDVPEESRTRWQRFVSRLPNVYLHCIMRSDDERALHDHPWHWGSLILAGSYVEVCHAPLKVGRLPLRGADAMTVEVDTERLTLSRRYSAGALRFHRATFAHRLVVHDGNYAWTLLFTGPRIRDWGFLCPSGWVHWRKFTDPATDGATVGQGCEP